MMCRIDTHYGTVHDIEKGISIPYVKEGLIFSVLFAGENFVLQLDSEQL